MKNLYELTTEFDLLMDIAYQQAEDNEGEISEGLSEKIDEIQMEREQKIENTVCLFKNINADIEAIKKEEKKLSERRKSIERQAERIKNWLATNTLGEKHSFPRGSISWRRSESVHVDDVELLDSEFVRVVKSADKTALKKALKAGEEIESAHIEENYNIVIK